MGVEIEGLSTEKYSGLIPINSNTDKALVSIFHLTIAQTIPISPSPIFQWLAIKVIRSRDIITLVHSSPI